MNFYKPPVEYLKQIYIIGVTTSKIARILNVINVSMMFILFIASVLYPIFIYTGLSILWGIIASICCCIIGIILFSIGIKYNLNSLTKLSLGVSSKPVLEIYKLKQLVSNEISCQNLVEYALLMRLAIDSSYIIFSLFMMFYISWWHCLVFPLLLFVSYLYAWTTVMALHIIKYKNFI